MESYCNLMYIRDIDERDELIRYTQAMDRVFMEHQRQQAAADTPSHK